MVLADGISLYKLSYLQASIINYLIDTFLIVINIEIS